MIKTIHQPEVLFQHSKNVDLIIFINVNFTFISLRPHSVIPKTGLANNTVHPATN